MKLGVHSLADLDSAIAAGIRSDYIYMYPPRQAYRSLPVETEFVIDHIKTSLAAKPNLNIYVHVPFCRQICGFCNLYTTNIKSADIHDVYVHRVLEQISGFMPSIPELDISTIYFGGGTPTALAKESLKRLILGVLEAFPARSPTCEVAIEVDPQTVNGSDLHRIKEFGINRINLGLQTRNDGELKTIGRKYGSHQQWLLASEAMKVGFENVCLDLIFGLPNQTTDSWRCSVDECIEISPHTICCYPLTERPHTGFAKALRARSSDSDYQMWDYADQALRSAGYKRQTHVRWARDGGGYIQKELHWGLDNVLGFGVGARSYLWDIDLRTNYSIRRRSKALELYLSSMEAGHIFPGEGVFMSQEERLRKAVILGLHELNVDKVTKLVGINPASSFRAEFSGLFERSLIQQEGNVIRLTAAGMRYRDLIVQMFFSDTIRTLTENFSYDE